MKQRSSNLELLRIISMCGIIMMHYFGMGGAVQEDLFPSFSWFLTHFLNSFAIPLVNCFVLITGYFLIKKNRFSLKKPFELLLITALYGIVSYIICVYAGNAQLSIRGGLEALFPYIIGKRWFVETYIILLLLAPFLGKLLRGLNRGQYHILLAIWLGVFCLWYSVGLSAPLLDDGYGIINFITLFMIGGYIRLYGADCKWLNKHKMTYLIAFIGCALMTFAFSYFINPYGYAFVTNIVGAVVMFVFALQIDLGTKKCINKISEATFDTYFVHSDFNTCYLLISQLLGAKYVTDTPKMIPHLLFVILVVWVIGFIAFKARKWVFSFTVERWLNKVSWISREIEV